MRDAQGQTIPTYDQTVVNGFARVFTESSLRAHDCEGWEFDGDFNPAGVQ